MVAGSLGADFMLVRYNTDGSLDTSFDSDGLVTTDFGGQDEAFDVAIQTDGKIVVVGESDDDFALARYNTDGSLDTTFDSDGLVTTDFGVDLSAFAGVVIQLDGKIVVAGSAFPGGFALARYNTDGSLDTSFDSDGKVVTTFGEGLAVALQPDGKIVVSGVTGGDEDFGLIRYNADGSLDTSFDSDGKVVTTFGGIDVEENAFGVAVGPNGKIAAAGFATLEPISFAVALYNTDGSLDTSFSSDGKATTDFGGASSIGNVVVFQPDGKIVVGGDSATDFALARFLGDAIPPRCEVIGINVAHAAPPTNLLVEVEDTGSGLDTINVLVAENAAVNIPAFDPGSNAVIQVVADKIDQGKRSRLEIEAFDVDGNRSTCDPVIVSLSSQSGGRMRETITDLPYEERYITLYGSDPGLAFVLVNANGRWFTLLGDASEATTIDVGSALVAGVDNTITLRVWGAGTVMVSDVVPARARTSRASQRWQQWSALRVWNGVWRVY